MSRRLIWRRALHLGLASTKAVEIIEAAALAFAEAASFDFALAVAVTEAFVFPMAAGSEGLNCNPTRAGLFGLYLT